MCAIKYGILAVFCISYWTWFRKDKAEFDFCVIVKNWANAGSWKNSQLEKYNPGGHLNIKMSCYQYMDPHVKDKTVSQSSYL